MNNAIHILKHRARCIGDLGRRDFVVLLLQLRLCMCYTPSNHQTGELGYTHELSLLFFHLCMKNKFRRPTQIEMIETERETYRCSEFLKFLALFLLNVLICFMPLIVSTTGAFPWGETCLHEPSPSFWRTKTKGDLFVSFA